MAEQLNLGCHAGALGLFLGRDRDLRRSLDWILESNRESLIGTGNDLMKRKVDAANEILLAEVILV